MDGHEITIIPIDITANVQVNEEDRQNLEKFRRMRDDFEHFTNQAEDPFGPCGFVHQLLEKALERAYHKAYNCIGQAKDPGPFICAAQHLKRCKELSREMTEEISKAMGDMHRGGSEEYNVDMMKAVGNLVRIIND